MRSVTRRLRKIFTFASIFGATASIGCSGQPADPVVEAASALAAAPPASRPGDSFTTFESGQVRPLALSADGRWLYATNTPDNRMEIFRVLGGRHLAPVASIPVGLEPVALAERCDGEVWVVNHLSDSVSIVDVSDPERAHVARTLLVGDEPRDIVFAGARRARAFITTAHRGQNSGRDPQLATPGVGRADVWVFDTGNLGAVAERNAARRHHAVLRHAAGARGLGRRRHGLRGGVSLGKPDHRRWRSESSRRTGSFPRRTATRRASRSRRPV